jgi:hypothetical protein
MITAAALALLLAVFAPMQAWAECAWVLWFTSGQTTVNTSALDAFPSRAECIRAKDGREPVREDYKRKYPDDFAYLTCLPDTIDPRGPKGGGR